VQSTSGHFLRVIITSFLTLAFVAILMVIFEVIIRRRKKSIKKQRSKNAKHENEFKFDDGLQNYDQIINGNEVNAYEINNYELDDYDIGVYDEINQN
jgi:hypothetical protein